MLTVRKWSIKDLVGIFIKMFMVSFVLILQNVSMSGSNANIIPMALPARFRCYVTQARGDFTDEERQLDEVLTALSLSHL
jgi:hypothetical protein